MTAPSSPEPMRLEPELWLLDHYLANPCDPLSMDLTGYTKHMLPPHQLTDPTLPLGAFVLALRLWRDDEIPENQLRGLRDLMRLHLTLPLNRLVQVIVAEDEPVVRGWGLERAEQRLQRAEEEPDPHVRERRVTAAILAVNRRGMSRWKDYLSAIGAVRTIAAWVGLLPSQLPWDPTDALHRSPSHSRARRPLEPWEMDLLWDAASHHQDPFLATLVLDFVRETAARRQAVIDLTLDDITWDQSYVTLHSKFDSIIEVPVSGDILERIALRAAELGWDGNWRPPLGDWEPNPSRAAFRRLDGRPLTTRWFDAMFNLVERQTQGKLDDRFTTHWLRHTTVSQIDQIAGITVAGQWAGHQLEGGSRTRGTATAHYVQWTIPQLSALHTRIFPNTPPHPVDPKAFCEKFAWLAQEGDPDEPM